MMMWTLDIDDDDAVDAFIVHPKLQDSQIVNTMIRFINGVANHDNEHNRKLAAKARALLTGETIEAVIQRLNAVSKRQRQTGCYFD